MKTTRLKGIVIVILALLNLLLLFLLLTQRVQTNAVERRTREELSALYEKNGILLDAALIPRNGRLRPAALSRDADAEKRFAEALFGTAEVSENGRVRIFVCEDGQCLIDADGTVDASGHRAAEDPSVFANRIFTAFGYRRTGDTLDGADGTVSAVRTADGKAIFNGTLELVFEDGKLVRADGRFVPDAALSSPAESFSASDALVRFLSFRNASGIVCTGIDAIENGYLLLSGVSAPRLVPVCRIRTDVFDYYVNFRDGSVTRG